MNSEIKEKHYYSLIFLLIFLHIEYNRNSIQTNKETKVAG